MGYASNSNIIAEERILLSNIAGVGDKSEDVDISSTDHTCTMTDCKMISAAVGNYIKVDFVNGEGDTQTAILPVRNGYFKLRNITKIYKTGTDATATNITIWR